jgi:hypothetical protein
LAIKFEGHGGAPSVPVAGAKPEMMGDKSVDQVKSESDALIAEIMAEGVEGDDVSETPAAPAGKGKGKGAKDAKPVTAGDDETDDEPDESDSEGDGDNEDESDDDGSDSDDDESDGSDSDDDAEPEDEDEAQAEKDGKGKGKGFAQARRQLKADRKAVEADKASVAEAKRAAEAIAAQNNTDAEMLDRVFGKAVRARKAAKNGDRDALRTVLEEITELPIDDAIMLIANPAGARSMTDIKLERLEKERQKERDDAAAAQAKRKADEDTQAAHAWIATELKGKRVTKLPGFEGLVLQVIRANYNKGIQTPKKALPLVLEHLKAQKAALDAVFADAAAPAAATDTDGKPGKTGKRGKGPLNRESAGNGSTNNARPQTTGDLIADIMLEEGFAKQGDKRLTGMRGKKVGAA